MATEAADTPEPAQVPQPVTEAVAEPLIETPSWPPVVETVETAAQDVETVVEVEPDPAPEPRVVELVVEQPSEPAEEAEPEIAPTNEPEAAEEPIAEAVTEPAPAPTAENIAAPEPEELDLPVDHIEPGAEIAPVIEDAVKDGEAPVMTECSDPEPRGADTEDIPSESAAEPLPEPLSETPMVAEVEVAGESEPEPPAAIAAAPEPSIEAIAEPAAVVEQTPAAEPPAPTEPTTQIETPQPAESTPAPEVAAAPDAAAPVVDEKAAARLAARQKKLDEADEQSPFSVIVAQVYDGPLDLLLDLIRKQDIDIYDIPIAKITSQFLAYVNQLKAGDVDVAGEFIYTASLLIHIKSKMLLPRAPAGPDDTPEDPRRELVERLLEHERFKNAAQMLQQKQLLEAASWTNPGAQQFKDDESVEPEIAADTVDLVRIFRDIIERARRRPVIDVTEDQVTVGQMIQFLARRLTMEDKPVALRRLLAHTQSERALIAMFLALLELVRLQAILLRQDRAFCEIFIKKHTGFDAVMNEGLVNARDDWK